MSLRGEGVSRGRCSLKRRTSLCLVLDRVWKFFFHHFPVQDNRQPDWVTLSPVRTASEVSYTCRSSLKVAPLQVTPRCTRFAVLQRVTTSCSRLWSVAAGCGVQQQVTTHCSRSLSATSGHSLLQQLIEHSCRSLRTEVGHSVMQ